MRVTGQAAKMARVVINAVSRIRGMERPSAPTDQAIADRIHTSKKTVQNCIQRLKEKLDIFGSEDEINARVAMCMTAVQKKIIQW